MNQVFRKMEKEMKKIIVLVALLTSLSAVFAFRSGDLLVGGNIELGTAKIFKNSGRLFVLGIQPQLTAFATKNIAADVAIEYAYLGDKEGSISLWGFGGGGKCLYKTYYVGMSYHYEKTSVDRFITLDSYGYEANSLVPKVGFLAPIASNVYLDVQAYYKFSIGDIKVTGATDPIDDFSYFGIRLGLLAHPNPRQ